MVELLWEARSAAHAGHCDTAHDLGGDAHRLDPAYVDFRVGAGGCRSSCTVAGLAGAGLEVVRLQHVGFELHAETVVVSDAHLFAGGLGVSIYL
ncbi:MAG TPA: hypothetical protein VH165_00135 [Kofleriaceae bacterium]|nr:hypothetical protein [Kofleriaceae bacterium]